MLGLTQDFRNAEFRMCASVCECVEVCERVRSLRDQSDSFAGLRPGTRRFPLGQRSLCWLAFVV